MVVSHRENSISSNIRAIIEQLNLNSVERRRLLDSRVHENDRPLKQQQQQQQPQPPSRIETSRARVTIGVYGLRQQVEGQLQIFCKGHHQQQQQQQQQPPAPSRRIVRKVEARQRQRIPAARIDVTDEEVPRKDAPTPPSGGPLPAAAETSPGSPLKEDLPELRTGQLSHTAALHRISVRPKNRRPPRRSNSNGAIASNGLPRIDSISENSIDTLDSLEDATASADGEAAADSKPVPIVRKSSSRLSRTSGTSRNSDVFEGLEAKLPTVLRRAAATASPDSLESSSNADARSSMGEGTAPACELPRPSPRTSESRSPRRRSSSHRLSKSPDSLESPGWLCKSSEGFDKLSDLEDAVSGAHAGRPVPAKRLLLKPISKSQERVCCAKSSDSLETALRALDAADDSTIATERRRSSFEIRPRTHNPVHKLMSKSTECFDSTLREQHQALRDRGGRAAELEKPSRTSLSEVNLARGSRHGKLLLLLSKSSENCCDRSPGGLVSPAEDDDPQQSVALEKSLDACWRPSSRRLAHSSESSDNLELDDNCKLESRGGCGGKERRRSSATAGKTSADEQQDSVVGGRRKTAEVVGRSLQRSSESSELGSTDTLDSERRNTIKSSDSEETLDSLEREMQEQSHSELDKRDEETTESVLEKREKLSNEEAEEDKLSSYWRRRANSQDSKGSDNLDIHQLLAYSLVSRIAQENGNDDNVHQNNPQQQQQTHDEDETSPKTVSSTPLLVYPKKKLHQQQAHTQQSSSEENKTLTSTINNILSSSNADEDLQNMLNGNISEVSTDTKSFKEKLIMFEKLGK